MRLITELRSGVMLIFRCMCIWFHLYNSPITNGSTKGPSDVRIHWLINGHSLDTPIMEYRRPLGQKEVLVSSWLREGPLIKDARYHCVAEASTGNDMSEVDLRLTIGDEESIPSRDLNQWRSALTEHEQLLKRWAKAWESCDGH